MTYFRLIRASLSSLETTFSVFSRPRPASPRAASHRQMARGCREACDFGKCVPGHHPSPRAVKTAAEGGVQPLTFATGGQSKTVVKPSSIHLSQRHCSVSLTPGALGSGDTAIENSAQPLPQGGTLSGRRRKDAGSLTHREIKRMIHSEIRRMLAMRKCVQNRKQNPRS